MSHSHDGLTAAYLELGEFDPSQMLEPDELIAAQRTRSHRLDAPTDPYALDDQIGLVDQANRSAKVGFKVTQVDGTVAPRLVNYEPAHERIDRALAELEEEFTNLQELNSALGSD